VAGDATARERGEGHTTTRIETERSKHQRFACESLDVVTLSFRKSAGVDTRSPSDELLGGL
jgi:hypothetical protein